METFTQGLSSSQGTKTSNSSRSLHGEMLSYSWMDVYSHSRRCHAWWIKRTNGNDRNTSLQKKKNSYNPLTPKEEVSSSHDLQPEQQLQPLPEEEEEEDSLE